MEKPIKLILASASPRRKELLGHLKIPFQILTKNIAEDSDHTDPVEFSRQIAMMKGQSIFDDFVLGQESVLVVSADTIVCLGNKIYGKPAGVEEARIFLNQLAGKTHSVFTAVCVLGKIQGQQISHSFVEESKVTFNPISEDLMTRYLATGDSLDKAGAYGIQNGSLTFISKVDGDYANVVGFPLSRFVVECEKILKPFSGGRSWFELF